MNFAAFFLVLVATGAPSMELPHLRLRAPRLASTSRITIPRPFRPVNRPTAPRFSFFSSWSATSAGPRSCRKQPLTGSCRLPFYRCASRRPCGKSEPKPNPRAGLDKVNEIHTRLVGRKHTEPRGRQHPRGFFILWALVKPCTPVLGYESQIQQATRYHGIHQRKRSQASSRGWWRQLAAT